MKVKRAYDCVQLDNFIKSDYIKQTQETHPTQVDTALKVPPRKKAKKTRKKSNIGKIESAKMFNLNLGLQSSKAMHMSGLASTNYEIT